MNKSPIKANWYDEYHQLLSELLGNYGTVHTPDGLAANLNLIEDRLKRMGFETSKISKIGRSDILIAKREPILSGCWIGLYGHYDVEPIEPGWKTNPKVLETINDRLYGRGTGDNLGPLALRLIAFKERLQSDPTPGIFWLFQGEEEIASPFAHEVFPTLPRPDAVLWLEETGYFNEGGDQRFLVMNPSERLNKLVRKLGKKAKDEGRDYYEEFRFLNKAFGQHQCPYLNHIVKNNPYLGIGPNDDLTRVHAPNESIPISTLELSFRQFNFLLDEVAKWY